MDFKKIGDSKDKKITKENKYRKRLCHTSSTQQIKEKKNKKKMKQDV